MLECPQNSPLYLQTVLNNFEQGILTLNQAGIIEFANGAIEKRFGYARSELIGQPLTQLIQDSDRAQTIDIEPYLHAHNPDVRGITRRLVGQHKDGTCFVFELALKIMQPINIGQPLFMGSLDDVRIHRATETKLREARDAAESANRAKSRFLSRMSHEFRTPMNAILGFSQLLSKDIQLTTRQLDHIDQIRYAGDHLLKLINEILELTRAEADLSITLENLSLSHIISTTIREITPQAKAQGITLDWQPDTLNCAIEADPARLKQVFDNLLSNAVKYNRKQGSICIITDNTLAEHVKIGIRDTGKGIREDQLSELFSLFNRLEGEDEGIDGSGIGLVTTQRLLNLMGGDITVESEYGVGSTFWVTLRSAVKR